MNTGIYRYQSYMRWLFFHLRRQKLLIFFVIVGIGFVTLSRVFIPVILGYIVDETIVTKQIVDLVVLLIIVFVAYLFSNGMDYITMMVGHYLGLKIEQTMRQEFFDTIQFKPLRYHDRAKTGDLQALATNDLRIINTMIAHGSFYVYPFFQALLGLILLFTLDSRLALVCSPFVVVYIYFVIDYRKQIAPWAADRMVKHSNVAVVLQESIGGAAVVKSFIAEKIEKNKFNQAVIGFRDNRVGEVRVQARFFPLLILNLAIGIVFLVSSLFVFQNTLSLGVLTAANLLLITLIHPTNMVFWATNDMMSGFAACSRLFNSLSQDGMENNEAILKNWPKDFKGKIEFKNVTFSYQSEGDNLPAILKNISFIIEPYQRVSIVGPTGCGKSTLIKLLLRLYEPQKGTIYLDDVDIRNYPLNQLRRHIGYIEQDIFLFSQSIKENIAFGKPNATDKEILSVAKLAQVDDFTNSFSEKFDTIVGERGTRLSGGEKQRVAIARAFLTDPDILILDDAASAVDSETEAKIIQALENIAKDRTTLFITHRLHTIRSSNKIIVLKRGQIVAEGTHDELLYFSEDYRRIFGKYQALPEITIRTK